MPATAQGANGLRLTLQDVESPLEVLELRLLDADGGVVWRLDPASEDCRRALHEAAAVADPTRVAPLVDNGRFVLAAAGGEAVWDLPLPRGPASILRRGGVLELSARPLVDGAFWHAQARRLGTAQQAMIEHARMANDLAIARQDSAELARIRRSPSWRLAGWISKLARYGSRPGLLMDRVRQYGGVVSVARLVARRLGLRRVVRRAPQPPGGRTVTGVLTPPSDWAMADYGAYLACREPVLMARDATDCQDQPTLSLCVPVYNPETETFRELIASVRSQSYPHWQLCLADDCSTAPHVARAAGGDRGRGRTYRGRFSRDQRSYRRGD